ncbi:zinc-binding dehydrogenase [Sporosarcina sp. Te-1]|uniref:zinc-binding dehydrogenase n=1 Tax=Sporosarcina sp. Te-1 TaxID=2818390 RepID=UPI001A9F4EDC|nr:zinc-binding dehydrogenase [Sporosarcina sp. Te-1]QTD43245.1 zinc-binding dehydrogenase [Sporosarcina sp. Te-1]
MKAFMHADGQLCLGEMENPSPGSGEVVVALKAAGLNRRDLKIPVRRGNESQPLVLGSDGAGVIESVGANVTEWSIGDEVIINPSLRWFQKSAAPPDAFDILGMPDHGTFAEKIVISAEQLEKKPERLSWEESGVVALSVLTGYRALFTQGELKAGQTVFIPGAGSGVATFMIQLAKCAGAKVIVTSRSEAKRDSAMRIGADRAIDTNCDWVAELKEETVDLVVESVGRATFNRSLEVLKQGGRIVVFGATTEDTVDFDLRSFFYGQYQLFGTTMGSREELRAALTFMEQHNIRPIIDRSFRLEEAEDAFKRLEHNEQFGKIVLSME